MADEGLPIDVEASPQDDVAVPEDIRNGDMAAVHGEGWNEPDAGHGLDHSLLQSLEQWLGKEHVGAMTAREVDALRRGVSRLPEPEGEESFVWSAIRSPDDVPHVAEAVVGYRRFDPHWLDLSDAMGANAHFRREIRALRTPRDVTLASFVKRGTEAADAIDGLRARITSLSEAMARVFEAEGFTLAAGLTVLGAADGLGALSGSGFQIGRLPEDEDLALLDGLRRRAVVASEAVRKICGVEPLRYSDGSLSGVRRSIMDKRPGDFLFAVEALGGTLGDREALSEAGKAFLVYFAACGAFSEQARELGYAAPDEPSLVARLSVRRCLRSAAREAGVEWTSVAGFLSLKAEIGSGPFTSFIEEIGMPGLSGRLLAVSKDRSRTLDEVAEAARKVVVTKRYWLAAGERVLAVRPAATLGEVREVMDAEPSVSKWRDALKEVGAITRADVDALERHLEWMVSAYALPIPDEAMERIVETRAAIVPMRLAAA